MESIKKIWNWIKNFLFTKKDSAIEQKVVVQPEAERIKYQTSQVYIKPYVKQEGSSLNEVSRSDAEAAMTAAILASLAVAANNQISAEDKTKKFESGGGGDFSGAGATGTWESDNTITEPDRASYTTDTTSSDTGSPSDNSYSDNT